jgi:transposase
MNLSVLGIDLAKQVFQVHGIDERGQEVLGKRLARKKLLPFLAQLPQCLVVMEAGGGAHYWAREIEKLGHRVKLLKAKDVRAYVQGDKDDRHDAAAVAEAGTRRHLREVPINSVEQQDLQSLHRVRELLIKERTALVNQARGLLAEYGVVIAKALEVFQRRAPRVLEDAENGLTAGLREILAEMVERIGVFSERIAHYDREVKISARADERCRRLLEVEGLGPMSTTALVAAVGDARQFRSGRQLSACLGTAPAHTGTGGKTVVVGLKKNRGNRYVRTLLIHGARSVVRHAKGKTDPRSRWINRIVARSGPNVAAVAVANKNARIAWALLTRGEQYQPGGQP